MSDEEVQAAKDKLALAIHEYYEKVSPEIFVESWVLLTHQESTEMSKDGQSVLGILVPPGQRFIVTTGIIEEARKVV